MLREGKSRKTLSEAMPEQSLKGNGRDWLRKRVGEHSTGSMCSQGALRGCKEGPEAMEKEDG